MIRPCERGRFAYEDQHLPALSGWESPKTQTFMAGDKGRDSVAPRGFEYWQRLADIINQEPVEERDRFFHAMLMPLGIQGWHSDRIETSLLC